MTPAQPRLGECVIELMHHFAVVTADFELLGVFTYEKLNWLPGDIVPQGGASLRVASSGSRGMAGSRRARVALEFSGVRGKGSTGVPSR